MYLNEKIEKRLEKFDELDPVSPQFDFDPKFHVFLVCFSKSKDQKTRIN
jgi:hypothetical protein